MNSITKKMVLNISMVCLLATSGVVRCSDKMPVIFLGAATVICAGATVWYAWAAKFEKDWTSTPTAHVDSELFGSAIVYYPTKKSLFFGLLALLFAGMTGYSMQHPEKKVYLQYAFPTYGR